ncbi:hypothetical protein ZHAS_00007164 [Anopheles sinensis]|uniref:Uncharacterized protein n=1 Tax=Anopheles sinensis TaxID=74873 RepID=A0A084VPA3_ANOSI|nr:hypothetical protein ZHAS_00007164 [Anopheles sinensis]
MIKKRNGGHRRRTKNDPSVRYADPKPWNQVLHLSDHETTVLDRTYTNHVHITVVPSGKAGEGKPSGIMFQWVPARKARARNQPSPRAKVEARSKENV